MPETGTSQHEPPAIDLEELAAFIDGKLEGDRRQRMLERLADDEEAYEIYDEAIRVRQELGTPKPAERLHRAWEAPRAPDRLGSGWLVAAALLAFAVFTGWLVIRQPQVAPSATMVARLGPAVFAPQSTASRAGAELPAFRSAEPTLFSESAVSFRLGVRSFDLALAAAADDPELGRQWLAEIGHLLAEVPLGSVNEERYRELAARIAEGASPIELHREIAAAERALEEELNLPGQPAYFSFGRWTEAIRTAAAAGDRGLLGSSAARRPVDVFSELESSPAVREALATIDRELARGDDADLATTESAVATILHACSLAGDCLES